MEREGARRYEWLAAVLPAVAFAATVVVFAWLLVCFWRDVGVWARRDLRAQAELAAENLNEPLRTQDFRKLTEFHQALEEKEMILRVRSAQGGWIFNGGFKGATVEEYVPCGDYLVGVAVEERRVYAPFYEALGGFVLAILVGVLGMFSVFFVIYRQRVRIRELARLEAFRRTFIADVSHEIKTPLTGIIGSVDALTESRDLPPEMRARLLAMLKKSSVRLDGLVRSILDLARLERGGESVERTETDLSTLVGEVVDELRPAAERAGMTLEVEVPAEPLTATVDGRLVSTAVSNLVLNAVRHSGGKAVRVSLASVSGKALLAVEDDGVGISPEHRARIFERFYRVDASRTDATGGSGLGLAIVRRIAELHGGTVGCEPVLPHGVRFTLAV